MTESQPPQWGAQAPGAPVPPPPGAPTEVPQQQPAKKSGGRLAGIIGAVVVIAIIAVVRFVIPAIENAKWKVGACTDYIPTSIIETITDDPKIVDCSDPAAKAEIVAVFDGKTNADADEVCPDTYVASMTRDGTLYCLIEA